MGLVTFWEILLFVFAFVFVFVFGLFLIVSLTSFIDLPVTNMFLWIAASVGDAAAANLMALKRF